MNALADSGPATQPRSYPRTFWVLTVAIVATGIVAGTSQSARVPLLSLFMPSVFIIMLACQVATCVLISVILAKSQRWELQPLVFWFLATALLDAAIFLTIRLPGRRAALLFPGNAATPWLFAGVHVVHSLCAIVYGIARSRVATLGVTGTRRALRMWLPLWAVIIVVCITVVTLAAATPAGSAAERTAGLERTLLFGGELLLGVGALAIYVRCLLRVTPNWIDLCVALTLIADITGLALNARPFPRYGSSWFGAQMLYAWSSTFVLIAAIHDLVLRLGDSLRSESTALRRRVAEAEQSAEVETSMLKSRFVAMVSHELRTPLGGIIGMAELLEREPLTERQAQFTQAIKTSANGLHRIVTDLLDFSRAESGRMELEDAEFDLDQAVDDIIVLFREQARSRGVAMYAFIDPIVPRTIRGDQTRLKQVLQNLVSNAVRFTATGSIRIEVIPSADEPGMLTFFVSDTGIGIAPHAIDRIFEAFVQEDASTARKFGGTGLGLAITKYLVEMMGGQIAVLSEPGLGTTFTFTLPARAVRSAGVEFCTLRDTSIVVFDEDDEARDLLVRYVEGWDMCATEAATAADVHPALARGTKSGRRFDLLLIGSSVPEATVAALIHEIRADVEHAPAGAILVREGQRDSPALTASFDICLDGPVRQSALFNAIVGLRRNTFAALVVPTIQGVPARAARAERVLVAEDNEVNQTLLCAQLEHLGLHADVVTDGEAAVAAALREPYDLIFMDCQMPHVDGFEATRRIRARSERNVPIIALTANVLPGYRETCLAAGMTDYLAKPALIGPLTDVIDRWLPAARPAETAGGADALTQMRARLREIFHGDMARAERVIAASFAALRDGAASLESGIAARVHAESVATAHKLKGVALEIGCDEIAGHARDLESALRSDDWERAQHAFEAFVTSIKAVRPPAKELA